MASGTFAQAALFARADVGRVRSAAVSRQLQGIARAMPAPAALKVTSYGRRLASESRLSTRIGAGAGDAFAGMDMDNMTLEEIQAAIDNFNAENAALKAKIGEQEVALDTDTKAAKLDNHDAMHLERVAAHSNIANRVVETTDSPMNIVYVTSEVAPWSKTGGLGDVAGALPPAMAKRGHRVMVIAPRYMNGKPDEEARYDTAFNTGVVIQVDLGLCGICEATIYHQQTDGVDWVFIDHPTFHRNGNPYGDTRGAFGDNQFRFTLLSMVACEIPLQCDFGDPRGPYGQKCVFFANDWHSAMVPVYISAKYRPHGVYKEARSILCIHNLAHQGVEPATTYDNLGLPGDWYGCMEWVFPEHLRAHELDTGQAVNIMKGALVTSDRVLTVSQGYAYEIATPEGGFGVDNLLRARQHQLNGITNGVDYDEWNPSKDTHLPANYSVTDLSNKAVCKLELQREMGLREDPDVPLIGFIGRLDYQKGPDMIFSRVEELMHMGVQVIMLGSGDPGMEESMKWAENNYGQNFRGYVGFSVPMAHRITAGADILLMPSRFEPCGLNQLYAMLYGTPVVAHATGGLRDTIEDFNPFAKGKNGAGTGWTFSPCDADSMMGALRIAVQTYREYPDAWRSIMERAMIQDFTWDRAAIQYEEICEWAVMDPPYS